MDYNKLFQSKAFKGALYGIAAFLILMFVLRIGMFLGFRKASFSYKWGENYHQNFAGPREGFFIQFSGKDFVEANGIFGQIIKIDNPYLVIKGQRNMEEVVAVKDNTVIMRFKDNITINDLAIDDNIVVIGQPTSKGQIEAKLIRVMPGTLPPPKN